MTVSKPSAASAGGNDNGASDSRGASVLVNAVDVLRCFTAEQPLQGVTEIAAQVGLHKSTVSRILATLEQEDLVERDLSSRRFKLGLGLIAVAGPLLADLDERRAAYPVLQELTERTGETSTFMVWNRGESVCVEQVPSRQQVKHTTPLGTRYNTAWSSSVQVFLANEGTEKVRAMLSAGQIQLPAATDENVEDYLVRLKQAASQGYATNYGETSLDEVGVAAPVFDHRGGLAGCVMVAAPRFRVSTDQLQALAEACRQAAAKITVRLGGQPAA
ncbi:IclR family transcriptional regulator [Crystallibacter crystallopoietes]|nr:IclR family transcriptional regulator [Arthrobacter crystallopoietes]